VPPSAPRRRGVRAIIGDVQGDELGHCIRAWRDRLDPAVAGIPAGAVALARALRLTDEERRHLEELPVLLYDAGWDLVAMNRLGTTLVGDMSEFSGRDRNLVWRQFNCDHSRFRSDAAQTAKREAELVADLRLTVYSTAPDTPDAEALARLGELVLGGVPG
jgi:MmyB-like transcription regulator ligand binding domain